MMNLPCVLPTGLRWLHCCAFVFALMLSGAIRAETVRTELQAAPAGYRVWLEGEGCVEQTCDGPFWVTVQGANQRQAQRLPWPGAEEQALLWPAAMNMADQSHIMLRDVDFDGQLDVIVHESNSGSYSGPVYTVYVYNRAHRAFVPHPGLSGLTQTGLGLFAVDEPHRTITVFEKSGCCWHRQTRYRVRPGGYFWPVSAKEEGVDASGEWVEVTETSWRRGVAKSRTRRYRAATYYPA